MTGETWRLGRRPALDGLRGVALLFVLFGHLAVPGLANGGPVGVTAFFALSGFLITSLLLEEYARNGRLDLRRFYVRRVRRLAPAQLVCVALVSLVGLQLGAWFLTPGQSVSAALYLTNLTAPHVGMLGHFWSLAVEEQFYLLWAPLLGLAVARWSRLGAVVLASAGIVASVALRGFAPSAWEATLPLRADALLIGCLAAALMHGRREGAARPRVALGATAILLGLGAIPFDAGRSWDLTLIATATAVLIWAVAQGTGSRWLSTPLLTWVGQRSYALYLWHWPIRFVLASAWGVTSWPVLVALVVPPSVLLAELSWRYVEQPLRARSRAEVGDRDPGLTDSAVGGRVANLQRAA